MLTARDARRNHVPVHGTSQHHPPRRWEVRHVLSSFPLVPAKPHSEIASDNVPEAGRSMAWLPLYLDVVFRCCIYLPSVGDLPLIAEIAK